MHQKSLAIPIGISWWYLIQLVIFTVVSLLSLSARHQIHVNRAIVLNLGLLVLGLWPLFEQRWEPSRLGHQINSVMHYVVTSVQMFLPLQLLIVIRALHHWTQLPMAWFVTAGICYLLIIYVPIAYLVFSELQSLVGRIIMSAIVIFSGMQEVSAIYSHLAQSGKLTFLQPWLTSGVLFAGMFVTFMLIAMRQWGYAGPHWKLATGMQAGPVFWLLLVTVAYTFWNGFGAASQLSNLFTRYQFKLAQPNLTTFLTGLAPGIAEEWLWRFVVLTLLLVWIRQTRYHWTWAVWLDGVLFGLWHISNLAVQGGLATVNQMISAAAAGALFAAMYLYTKAIWAPMLFHTAVDSVMFMVSGSTTMGDPQLVDWAATLIQIAVFTLLTYYMLSGQRRQMIEKNWQLV